jgi:curli biogenesis system outer membrane secretion channel CsgG
MMKYSISILFVFTFFFFGCATTPESNVAAEDMAWDLADQLTDLPEATIAVGRFDTKDIPDRLDLTFRNDLSTALAIAVRELEMNHRVVTRGQVDNVLDEQALALQGLTARDAQFRVGELLGAQVLVVGTIIWLEGDLYRANSQLIESATGVVLGGSSWDFWFDTESDR